MFSFQRQNGDIVLDEGGQLVPLRGLPLFDQEVGESLSIPYDPASDQGNKLLPNSPSDVVITPLSKGTVQSEIGQVISRLQRAQNKEPFLTPFEAVGQTKRLVVINDATKKTSVLYYIEVQTQQGETAPLSGVLPPGPGTIYSFPPTGAVRTRTGGR